MLAHSSWLCIGNLPLPWQTQAVMMMMVMLMMAMIMMMTSTTATTTTTMIGGIRCVAYAIEIAVTSTITSTNHCHAVHANGQAWFETQGRSNESLA